MSGKRAICDRELLRQSLNDTLSDRQEEELTRHLSECAACQQELELLAAQQAEWSQVGSVLKREADSSVPTTHFPAEPAADHFEDAAADFSVDFLEPSPAPEAIGRLAEIDILEVIGRGGMGIVLKGFQPELKRLVAVKVLAPHLATSGAARQRFAREAQAAAAIMHPNVMPIFTVHSTGKVPFLVMPYVACESLEQRITRQGPLELADILRIGTQTAKGLAAAHAQGLVHRDVKPANILLEKGVERVLLTDFGLARAVDDASLTRTGLIAGTPQFMSPEQARGDAIDARSDLFSLGSVLYTMATGRRPFRAETSFGILRRITDTQPRPMRDVNPKIPDWLAAIVEKLHAKAPEARFASAEEVARLLEGCLAHLQQPTGAPLPAAANVLARSASWRKRIERVSSLFHRNGPAGTSVRVWPVAIAAIAIVVGIVLLGRFAFVHERGDQPHSGSAGQAVTLPGVSSVQNAASPAANRPVPVWRDEIADRILESQREIERLEEETRQPWGGDQPSGPAGTSSNLNETREKGSR
ncbi:MAG TPA: protein kinase [Planctomycetaceae bacterium]|jgi:serine/threonine-protein kinase|nr:protein kinase [Planctomycetaceae bacterium]